MPEEKGLKDVRNFWFVDNHLPGVSGSPAKGARRTSITKMIVGKVPRYIGRYLPTYLTLPFLLCYFVVNPRCLGNLAKADHLVDEMGNWGQKVRW